MKNKVKIRKEIQIFRESVHKIVVMLSGKNIPVAECGNRAYVEYNADGTPELVNLPSIPDDATDGLMNAIRGFLDHEVAHLLFTDSKLAFRLLSRKDSPAFQLWNAVEDTYIERRMGEVFAGSKRNLINTQRHVIDKLFIPKVDEALAALASNPRDLFLKFFLMPSLRAWAGQTPFIEFMEPYWPLIRIPVSRMEKAGVTLSIRSLKNTEDCIKMAARISEALREEMESPEEESGSGEPSKESKGKNIKEKVGSKQPIYTSNEPDDNVISEVEGEPENAVLFSDNNNKEDNIKDKEEGEAEPDNESKPHGLEPFEDEPQPTPEPEYSSKTIDDQAGDASEQSPPEDDGQQSSTELNSRNDTPDYELDSGDFDESAFALSSGENDEQSEQDGDDLDKSNGSSGSASDSEGMETDQDGQNDYGEHETGKGDIPLDEAFKALEGADAAPEQGMEEALNEVIANELKGVSSESYRPFQRSYDFIGPIDDAEAFLRKSHKTFGKIEMHESFNMWRIDREGTELFANHIESSLSDGTAATLAKDLERAIASKNKVQFIPGQRRGKVHSANLYRLSINDDRVFRRKEDHKAVNACVQQVLDLSGSMCGAKIKLALACAYTIADALDRINVPNIITGFTTAGCDVDAMRKHHHKYSRYEGLMLPTIKGWHERANTPSTRQRIGCLSNQFPLVNNIDGESIMALAQHFSARTEDKKIMLVLSDGAPAGMGFDLSEHLKAVAGAIESSGQIEMLAVGVLTDAPKHFYKNHVLVKKVSELGATVVKKLSSLILS